VAGVGGLLLVAVLIAFTGDIPTATATGAIVHTVATWMVFYIPVSCPVYPGIRAVFT
jgi:hypothetical protein